MKTNLFLTEYKGEFLLLDRKAFIPRLSLFFASDRNSIHVNRWNSDIKAEMPFYYLIVASTAKLSEGEVPLLVNTYSELHNIIISRWKSHPAGKEYNMNYCEIEKEWWLKDATGKTETKLNPKPELMFDGNMKRGVVDFYEGRLYNKVKITRW